jgi:hypothetical protein
VSVATSTVRPRAVVSSERVEKRDGVLAAVAGEMAVVAVDHCQACAHESGKVEDRDTGTEREGRVGVAQVVGASDRFDPGKLCRPPVALAEAVKVDVTATGRREQQRVIGPREAVERLECHCLQRVGRAHRQQARHRERKPFADGDTVCWDSQASVPMTITRKTTAKSETGR